MKVFIKTFGCQANYADSEVLAGILSKKFKLVNSVKEANVKIKNKIINVKAVSEKELDPYKIK